MPNENKPDQDHLLEHSYDGIQEFDNPMPRWWVYLFWATIIFSILYFFNVPGFGIGKGRIADYDLDLSPPRTKQIEVTVIDADGGAAGGAQIMVVPASGAPGPDPVLADGRGIARIDAQVGDAIHAFAVDPTDPDPVARVGRAIVSDDPGSYEEIEIRLER